MAGRVGILRKTVRGRRVRPELGKRAYSLYILEYFSLM